MPADGADGGGPPPHQEQELYDRIVDNIDAADEPHHKSTQERAVLLAEVKKRDVVSEQIRTAARKERDQADKLLSTAPSAPDRTLLIYTNPIGAAVVVPEMSPRFAASVHELFVNTIVSDWARLEFNTVVKMSKRADDKGPTTYHYLVRALEYTVEIKNGTPKVIDVRPVDQGSGP